MIMPMACQLISTCTVMLHMCHIGSLGHGNMHVACQLIRTQPCICGLLVNQDTVLCMSHVDRQGHSLCMWHVGRSGQSCAYGTSVD